MPRWPASSGRARWACLRYAPKMNSDSFRTPQNFLLPDPRNQYFGYSKFEDLHSRIVELSLSKNHPQQISIAFDTAKNLYLYAWYVYRFFAVSELQALVALEMALKTIARANGKNHEGLSQLLKLAVEMNWLDDDKITQAQRLKHKPSDLEVSAPDSESSSSYLALLAWNLPALRNMYGHGDKHLSSARSAFLTLEICRDLIDQLPTNS